jgi:hypothetical protein
VILRELRVARNSELKRCARQKAALAEKNLRTNNNPKHDLQFCIFDLIHKQ